MHLNPNPGSTGGPLFNHSNHWLRWNHSAGATAAGVYRPSTARLGGGNSLPDQNDDDDDDDNDGSVKQLDRIL